MSAPSAERFPRLATEADRMRAPGRERGPIDGGGGSGDDGQMEARIAKLEASVGHIERDVSDIKSDIRELRRDGRTDFRVTWGAMIAGFLGIAALMARGFGWL